MYNKTNTVHFSNEMLAKVSANYEKVTGTNEKLSFSVFFGKIFDLAIKNSSGDNSEILVKLRKSEDEAIRLKEVLKNKQLQIDQLNFDLANAESLNSSLVGELKEKTDFINNNEKNFKENMIIRENQMICDFEDRKDWKTYIENILIVMNNTEGNKVKTLTDLLVFVIASYRKDYGYFDFSAEDIELIKKVRNG